MSAINLVLASSSRYRVSLLERLAVPFTSISPEINESPLEGELPADQVLRLSKAKAERVAEQKPEALIIASDQIASANNLTLCKPGNAENAIKQLKQLSAQIVTFHTGLYVMHKASNRLWLENIQYKVHMRKLSDKEIERYVAYEKPFDCAGSFKSEGLGIALFAAMEGHDPTALIGLPLIRLSKILNEAGITIP